MRRKKQKQQSKKKIHRKRIKGLSKTLNEGFKWVYSYIFFYLLYLPHLYEEIIDPIKMFSIILLYVSLSSVMSLGMSYISVMVILKYLGRPQESFLDFNSQMTDEFIISQVLIQMFKSFYIFISFSIILKQFSNSIVMFLTLYIISRSLALLSARILAKRLTKKFFLFMFVLLLYISLIFVAIDIVFLANYQIDLQNSILEE